MKPQGFFFRLLFTAFAVTLLTPAFSDAWNDEVHLAIAKAAGYKKWYNAASADIAKLKAGQKEAYNHFVNNTPGMNTITAEKVLRQAIYYNNGKHSKGHLYGAIIASIRDYKKQKSKGEYAEAHLAYAVHYIGDLSQPLHNIVYNRFNKENHYTVDMLLKDEILNNADRIEIYRIDIKSEKDLAEEIARIANISIELAWKMEKENRLLTREEAYAQIGHSASLLKGILKYLKR